MILFNIIQCYILGVQLRLF